MRRALLSLLALLPLLLAAPSRAGTREDAAVAGVQEQWAAAFAKQDIDALVALYGREAHFYGSSPPLFIGQDGVRAYFKALPWAILRDARFSDTKTVRLGPGIVITAGLLNVEREVGGEKMVSVVRLTMTLQRQDGVWRIVSHHASPKS